MNTRANQKRTMKKKGLPEKKPLTHYKRIFFILLVLVLMLSYLNLAKAKGWLVPEQPEIKILDRTISLDSLSLEQKIAQMLIVHGGISNLKAWQNLQVGGVHLFAMEKEELFTETITQFQEGRKIPFFVTVDLEGCLNPFANFKEFPSAIEITTEEAAREKGQNEGKYLSSLGVTVNFAPVADLKDEIWKCRAFSGDGAGVIKATSAYVNSLQQEGVIATAKHYPGKTLVISDPHIQIVSAEIDAADVEPFSALSHEAQGIMISHIIASGKVDSGGLPTVTSAKVIGALKEEYEGLIISDEINMLGLKKFYPTLDEMYVAVFKAGNDLILNFNDDPNEIYRMIQIVKKAVESEVIREEQIDTSVRKILQAKGFKVQ